MKQCRLTGSFLAFVIVFMFSASSGADVYINDYPADISVEEGKPLEVPLILTGGSNTGKPVELFIWKEGLQNGSREYFGPAGWVPFTDFADMKSVISVVAMIQHIYFVWPAIGDTTGIESFKLSVCMDSNVDGLLGPDTSTCDERGVQIEPAACAGIIATPASITKSVEKGTSSLPVQIAVTDSCGTPVTFNAAASQSWIGLAKQQGILTVTLNAATLNAASYSGAIILTSGTSSATVAVSLTVTNPVNPPPSCTVSSIFILPISIGAEAGTIKQVLTSVTNNCGTAVAYGATVTSGNAWLSSPATGSGTITVTVNSAGLAAGAYHGTIALSASGLPTATLNVSLTVTGECVPNAIYVSPSSISKTALTGTNAESVLVTVKTNCGADLDYTITGVSANWSGATAISGITLPAVNSTGKGSFTVSFNTGALAVGSYPGSISFSASLSANAQPQSVTIPVTVVIGDTVVNTIRLTNGVDYYDGFNPGDVKWFVFEENTADGVNDNVLLIQIADMIQTNGFYNVDLLVRYAGPTCDDSKMPTMSDRDRYLRGELSWGQDGYYGSFGADAFETLIIPNNPEGCYYIMVANVDLEAEPKIRVKYSDIDSM